jgi:RNA polymerase sigma-70 factor (ECF subfamily)
MDPRDVERFIAEDYARVVRAVTLITGSRWDAEDAVQDALAKAWNRRDLIVSLPAWITVVSSNGARSGFRRRRVAERVTQQSLQREPDVQDTELRMDVERALSSLSVRQRQVVVLHYVLGLRVGEMAPVLGIAEGTVKTLLHRARAALAHNLQLSQSEVDCAHDR